MPSRCIVATYDAPDALLARRAGDGWLARAPKREEGVLRSAKACERVWTEESESSEGAACALLEIRLERLPDF